MGRLNSSLDRGGCNSWKSSGLRPVNLKIISLDMLFSVLGLNDTMKGVSVKKSFMEQPWCSPGSTALGKQTKVELLSQVNT